jgi:hypothetical protein
MDDDLEFEKEFWGTCVNTFEEDQKHYVYAKYLGLEQMHYNFNANNKTILDIGGGPTSMLLKCKNLKYGKVVDPIEYPTWTKDRYTSHNIEVIVDSGENVNEKNWDEVWIYNCLQHVEDPNRIIQNALKAGKILRIFEWINLPPHPGHPHELTSSFFYNILKNVAKVKISGSVPLAENGCYGTAFYGVFESLIYEQN